MTKKEILKNILDDMDCENITQADDMLDNYLQNNEFDDIDRICAILNAGSDKIHFNITTTNDYMGERTSRIGVYCYKHLEGKDYLIQIENDYINYDQGISAIICDILAYELEAKNIFNEVEIIEIKKPSKEKQTANCTCGNCVGRDFKSCPMCGKTIKWIK